MNRALMPACLLLLPCLAPAQNRPPKQPVPEIVRPEVPHRDIKVDGNGFTLPEGEVTVTELIDAAARFLGRNILWNSQELQAVGGDSSFYLQKTTAVDAVGCEELLYSMLFTKGLAVLPVDEPRGFYEVVALNGPRGREVSSRATSRSVAAVLRRPNFKQYVLVTVPLQHVNAQVASAALRPFFAGSNNQGGASLTLGNVGNNSSILLMGFGDQVAAAIAMLQECDTPQPPNPQTQPVQEQLQSLAEQVAKLQAQVRELAQGKSGN
jgi:hypothetical protein